MSGPAGVVVVHQFAQRLDASIAQEAAAGTAPDELSLHLLNRMRDICRRYSDILLTDGPNRPPSNGT